MASNQMLDKLIDSVESSHPVALVTVVKATGSFVDALGKRALVWPDRAPYGDLALGAVKSQVIADVRQCLLTRMPQLLAYHPAGGTIELFVEVQRRPPALLIVGAGHVALPLAELGRMIGLGDEGPQPRCGLSVRSHRLSGSIYRDDWQQASRQSRF
jgi:xanthine dehydrogenase accessory factor